MSRSQARKNVIGGFVAQLIILALGMVFPRIILEGYGSDANGLISTITQIFAYMALLEAGIKQAAKNELYRHIVNEDKAQISVVAATARRYFRKITAVYSIGVLVLALLMPFIIKSNIDKTTIFFAVFFEGMAGALTFYFVQTPSSLLSALGKDYVNNGVDVCNKSISYLVRIFLAMFGVSIFFLQFSYCIITVARSIFYVFYFKKHYGWIDFSAGTGKETLKDRNSYVVNELAWTIFSSTSNIILSVFVGTELASVYAIYNMVFNALNTLLNAVYTSVSYILGQTYHDNLKSYERLHDNFTTLFLGAMTIMMSVAYILILPFVKLYTRGITDIDYINASLPLLFCLIRIISWSRYVTGNLTGVAGYAKSTSRVSLIEAGINIVVSLVLVQVLGIIGVLIGSVVALPIKVIYCTYIADKKVLHRSYRKSLTIFGTNYAFFAAVVLISRSVTLSIGSYMSFFLHGIIISLILGALGLIVNLLANPECAKWMMGSVKKSKT